MGEKQGTGKAMVKRSRNRGSNCRVERARNWCNVSGQARNKVSMVGGGTRNRGNIMVGGRARNKVAVGEGARNRGNIMVGGRIRNKDSNG